MYGRSLLDSARSGFHFFFFCVSVRINRIIQRSRARSECVESESSALRCSIVYYNEQYCRTITTGLGCMEKKETLNLISDEEKKKTLSMAAEQMFVPVKENRKSDFFRFLSSILIFSLFLHNPPSLLLLIWNKLILAPKKAKWRRVERGIERRKLLASLDIQYMLCQSTQASGIRTVGFEQEECFSFLC